MKKLIAIGLFVMLGAVGVLKLRAQTGHYIEIAWTYTQGADAAVGFNVLSSYGTGGPYTIVNSTLIPISTLTYKDTSCPAGKTCYYVVEAQDAAGAESGYSAQVSAVMIGNPTVPGGVTATAH